MPRKLSAQVNGSEVTRMFAVGDLSAVASSGAVCDYVVVPEARRISAIDVICPDTPTSGSIVIDLVYRATPGGTLSSLYSANSRPSLACNGYASWATFSGANLPDETLLDAGSVVGFKVVSAPADARDIYVTIR